MDVGLLQMQLMLIVIKSNKAA